MTLLRSSGESSRITLGTVQLGMPYGIGAARAGISEETALAILDEAWSHGIRCFDTARMYGQSERRIGQWLDTHAIPRKPLIISKFPALDTVDTESAIAQSLAVSRRALGVARVDVYLAHRGSDLLRPGAVEALAKHVAKGEIGSFGASLYDAANARALLELPGIAALQLPIHLANLSAYESGLLERAAIRGVAIFARSVFLKGLLLRDSATLESEFSGAAAPLARLERLARNANTTQAALALAVVRSLPGVSSIVIGVDSVRQLAENLTAYRERIAPEIVADAIDIGRSFPPELADPRRWRR